MHASKALSMNKKKDYPTLFASHVASHSNFTKNFSYSCINILNLCVLDTYMTTAIFVTGSAKTEHNSAIEIFQYKALKYIG